ncbi:MAG: endonuclease V [Halanaerobiales bacterium]
MIFAVDVQYLNAIGFAAGVQFEDWKDEKPVSCYTEIIENIHEYIPGQFYKRELPCIMALLTKLETRPDIIVVDGFVYLGGENKPGLGAYLYSELQETVPVIGVAKRPFHNTPKNFRIFRGKSKNPLYISAAGIDLEVAKKKIGSMYGPYRIPEMLKTVDRLCRDLVKK